MHFQFHFRERALGNIPLWRLCAAGLTSKSRYYDSLKTFARDGVCHAPGKLLPGISIAQLNHVTTQRKNEAYVAKFKPTFIDVGAVLDGYEKWGKMYEDIIQGRTADAGNPAAGPAR